MTRPYSEAFKSKMVERLTGKDAVSALRVSKDTGVRQQSLSRWLREARNLPDVIGSKPLGGEWTVAQKAKLPDERSPNRGCRYRVDQSLERRSLRRG